MQAEGGMLCSLICDFTCTSIVVLICHCQPWIWAYFETAALQFGFAEPITVGKIKIIIIS